MGVSIRNEAKTKIFLLIVKKKLSQHWDRGEFALSHGKPGISEVLSLTCLVALACTCTIQLLSNISNPYDPS